MRWELAADERFHAHRRARRGGRRGGLGAQRPRRAAGLEPGRWYWYRFHALGQQSAVGRTRTAPAADAAATLRFAIASCQRYDVGHYAAWRHAARPTSTSCSSSATTSTSTRRGRTRSARSRAASLHARRSTARATRPTRATRRCRPRTRARRGCWSGTTTRSATTTPSLQGQDARSRLRGAPHGRLPRLLGAHAVPELGAAGRRRHAHRRPTRLGPARAHPPARRPPVPRSAGLPEARPRRLEHGDARRSARRSPIRRARCSAPSRNAGSPTAGTWSGRGTWSRSRR